MGIRSLRSTFLLATLATLAACGCQQQCPKCVTPLPPTPAPPTPAPPCAPAGGLGIPYSSCVVDTQCNSAALTASGLDPKGNLVARNLCETKVCRAYYNASAGSVCLHGDTIKCAKSPNVFGTATCNNGNFGTCQ